MKWLKTYKLFESIGNDLPDILLEINDETYWQAECYKSFFYRSSPNSQTGKWVIVIQTVYEDEEYEYNRAGLVRSRQLRQKPPPIVTETVERAIDFMNSEGFTNYQITFETDEDDQYEEITLEEVSDLDVWSNNFIRIEFWK